MPPLAEELHRRGVSPAIAKNLLGEYTADQIFKQVEVFDWILERDADRFDNPAGFLVQSIRQDFAAPNGYQTKEDQNLAASQRASIENEKAQLLAEENESIRKHQLERKRVEAARAKLTDAEPQFLEDQAITEADEETRAILANPTLREIQIELLVDRKLSSR